MLAPQSGFIAIRSPPGLHVGQDDQADDLPAQKMRQARVIVEHSLGEGPLSVSLDFDVQVDAAFGTSLAVHPYQLVHQKLADGRISADFLEFRFPEFETPWPVDLFRRRGEKEVEELGKKILQHILPRRIVFGHVGALMKE
ncbi:hypothetical protein [Sulfidibacter corallicola]|uniref:Uncharacterized protein n=1 Tax=Sulfidibacter corallicola TaxID=2818388 RepID=A0A8A4TEX1_SULCO|nr:hypothetical protein [Sulfidibacter corallicola]QTD47764.1 hypothetical protein J3U87_19425 [Sulfidibacter corallicola]